MPSTPDPDGQPRDLEDWAAVALKKQLEGRDVQRGVGKDMEVGLRDLAKACRALLALAVCLVVVGGWGCRGPGARAPEQATETGTPAELAPGQAFRFVDHFAGGAPPVARARRTDGPYRLALGEIHQPVLHAPAPYVMRQKLTLPAAASLRLGFGLTEESRDKPGDSVRFAVRLRGQGETVELLSTVISGATETDAPNWRPVTIDLGAYARQRVEIELATEVVGAAGSQPEEARSAYAVWVNPVVAAPPAEGDRPNMIVVVVDSARADHLGCYGYQRRTSPFLDELSREGVLFEEAHAEGTYTLASVPGLLTSKYRFAVMPQLGSSGQDSVGSGDDAPALKPLRLEPSLQGVLQSAGYTTFASVGGGFLSPVLGMDADFDWYWSTTRERVLASQLSRLRQHLSDAPPEPFFLFLHTYELHNYFRGWGDCLAEFDRGYAGKLTDSDRLAETVLSGETAGLSSEDLQYIVDLYDGELSHTDRLLGEFMRWVLAQPWGGNTIIAVTADHGELLGEYGWLHHGLSPRPPLVHIPLIVRLPDGRGRGRRVAEPVSLVDVMPTLLSYAGIPPPSACAGRSLIGLINGKASVGPRAILCESPFGALMVREGRWWYLTVAGHGVERLYDMVSDPGQKKDLSSSSPQVVGRMRRLLAELAMEAACGGHLVVAGPRPKPITLTLDCDQGFSYLFVPTLREPWEAVPPGAADTKGIPRHLEVPIPAGDETHVILFEPEQVDATVLVSATIDGREAESTRFRVGKRQQVADGVPVPLRFGASWLESERPPAPREATSWGIRLWLVPTERRQAAESSEGAGLDPALAEHLKALGYLR